jgi:hypothetical protein
MALTRRDFVCSLAACIPGALVLDPDLLRGNKEHSRGADHEDLLVEIERRACRFFFEQADPDTGQVKDRARHSERDSHTISSIAATGFGLSAMCIAHQNRFLNPGEVRTRVERTLEFIARHMPQEHGFFYHFIDMHSAARAFSSEVSSIDTAILLLGILNCRAYFEGNANIAQLANDIYGRVDWKWMLNGGETLDHGWKPEGGFLRYRWDSYSELTGMYLLAIGSPTHPIPASSWEAWSRPVFQYGDLRYISAAAPLFIHQSAHAWVDFRNQRDAHADYFQNSVIATIAHKRFCLSLHDRYPWFSNDLWGITASDSEHGYVVWGGPPAMGPIDGTVVPCAAGGSLVFTPDDCRLVLKTIFDRYPRAWTRYGFVDAFNPKTGWYDPEVLGIDLGITLLMAENLRNQGVWKSFMRNQEITRAMKAVGFKREKP